MSRAAPAILFDLDGPLLDVSDRYFHVHCAIAGPQHDPACGRERYWALKRERRPLDALLAEVAPGVDPRRYAAEWLRRIEHPDALRHDRLVPGARGVLDAVASTGYLAHLVTLRRDRTALLTQLERLGIRDRFHGILSRGAVGAPPWEIKADMIRGAGVPLGPRVMIVGDTEADVLAGRQLGITTVAVTGGIRAAEFLAELRPDLMISSLRELPALLSWGGIRRSRRRGSGGATVAMRAPT